MLIHYVILKLNTQLHYLSWVWWAEITHGLPRLKGEIMKSSVNRAQQCRQIYLHEVHFAVNGTAVTPVASGLDANFVESVTDLGAGNYKITFIDKAQRSIVPGAIVASTASRVGAVTAVDSESITVQFRDLAGVAADSDFNMSVLWHGSKHLF